KPFFGGCNNVDMYRKISRIGEGTYGIVYSARNKETNEVVALKKIRMEKEKDGLPISSLREIALLKSLQHENIINVKDVVVGGAGLHNIFIVMEYCKQVSCIFGELLKHRPIMPGNTEMNQLQKIFELIGVPNPKIWSGFDKLPLARSVRFPAQKFNQLKIEFPHVSDNAIDLLNGLLTYDPQKRFTVNQAIHHKYFKESPWPKPP
ncbi:hypothetical protein PIROE2DRAFT_27679, partial [Piromyces sp. E2]